MSRFPGPAVLLLCLLAAGCGAAAAGDDLLLAGPPGLPTGTVLHYVKTNLDGTRPEQIALWVASPQRIEVYKYHPRASPAGLVAATFDWEVGSLVGLRSVQRRPGEEPTEVASLDYDPATRTGQLQVMGVRAPVAFSGGPISVYAFEMADLNMRLARATPEVEMEVLLVDLDYRSADPSMFERGAMRLRYQGEELRGGRTVRRYAVTGPALEGQAATFWLNAREGYIEEVESPVPNHPDWSSYRLRLLRRERMTAAEWESFQREVISG